MVVLLKGTDISLKDKFYKNGLVEVKDSWLYNSWKIHILAETTILKISSIVKGIWILLTYSYLVPRLSYLSPFGPLIAEAPEKAFLHCSLCWWQLANVFCHVCQAQHIHTTTHTYATNTTYVYPCVHNALRRVCVCVLGLPKPVHVCGFWLVTLQLLHPTCPYPPSKRNINTLALWF